MAKRIKYPFDVKWVTDWSKEFGRPVGTLTTQVSRVFSTSIEGAKKQIKKRKGFSKLISVRRRR